MFIGHYGAAFALAAARPTMKLWPLVLGVQALDVAWAGLVLAGIEKVRIVPGILEASDLDLFEMPWTHSLPAALVWSFGLGLAWALAAKDRTGGWLVGVAVFSHWIADLLVHAPDLLLWPGGPKVGLGLWHDMVLSQTLEGLVLAGGFALWLWRCRPHLIKAAGLAAIMAGLQLVSHLPAFAPHSPAQLALNALAVYLLLTAFAWALFDRRSAA